MRKTLRALVLLVGGVLAACSSHHDAGGAAAPAVQRGSLLRNPPTLMGTYTPQQLVTVLGGNDVGRILLLQLAYTPKCTITVYHLDYETVDPQGALTPAGGALMVPSGSADCQGGRPATLYAHGTSTTKTYDISAFASTNNSEGMVLAAVFAAEGYIVVAPNYVGYDTSTLSYHPFLVADQQSKDMIDALTAARSALPVAEASATTDGGKLFVTGYSQGGYVAMATHRAMQAAGMTVTAAVPMSGPYALSAFADAIFEGEVNASGVPNAIMLIGGYQHSFGNVYSSTTDVFSAQYATGIDMLLPGTTPVSTLRDQGKVPDALFSSTPPDPSFAAETPATQPANLAPVFAAGFAANNFLITNAYRLSYLQDALANPDGGFPTAAGGLPPGAPANALRQDLKNNDLRTWSPAAPVLLCAGNSDPTVFYLNTQLMANYWSSVNAGYTLLDVDSSPAANDPYATVKNEFALAKRALSLAGGDAAVLAAYHAGLVLPFCLSAAKGFLDAH